ncbi:MAG TPA: glycosyltransferase, partial [Blastocatellia bacterium]|nr:glycosyltransferase [Blastocatellia bacterium]
GEFIAFLDADDVWLPEKLAEQVAILAAHPQAAMLYGRTQKWFGWTGDPEDMKKDALTQLAVEPETLAQPPLLLTRFLKNEHVYPCTCSMLVRRTAFDKVGMFEESFRDAYEDMVFHTKIFLNAPVFVSGKCWDRYRRHPDNSWKRMVEAGLYDPLNPNPLRRDYLRWVEQYLLAEGVTEGEVWRALRQELWPYRHPALYRLSKAARRRSLEAREVVSSLARRLLPAPLHQWLRNQVRVGKSYE